MNLKNNSRWCVHVCIVVLSFFYLEFSSLAQTSLTDSLEKILPSKQGKEKLQVLGDLCYYLSTSDVNKAEKFGRDALSLAEEMGDSTLVASAANDLSTCLYRKGEYDAALAFTNRALSIRKKAGDKKAIGSSLNKLVNIYSDQVKLDSALKYALEAAKIFEEAADTLNEAISLNTIASIYTKEKEWNTCMKYAQQAYELGKAIGHPYPIAGAAGNIALASQETGKFDDAIKWYTIALDNFELLDSKVDMATVASNLGVIYRQQGDLPKAKSYYEKALQSATEVGERNGLAHYNANLGGVNLDLGFFEESEKNFTIALQIAREENLGRIKLQCYDGFGELYSKTNRAKESYVMMQQYKALNDSLYNSEKSGQLADMRTKYETEKKEHENEILQKENEMAERENKYITYGSVALIALLSIAGIFYYNSYKRKQEARMQTELVRERELGLEAVFTATEEERKRIAKDLHDGIGQQLSGLKLGFEALKNKLEIFSPEETKRMHELSKVLDESAQEVRSLSHQMMPKALQERGLLPAIEDMLRKSLGLSDITYRVEHFNVENQRFAEKIEVGLYRVCQELVNNISKHSKATEVAVQLFKNKNNLVLIVEDNGRGFDSKSKRDGIGLMNITSRLSTIHGEATWEPGPQAGTVATARVPVS